MADDHYLLLLYDYVSDMVERRGPYRDAHLERIRAEKAAGRIVMAGALGDPLDGGAIVFRNVDPEHVEQFVAGDPYRQAELMTAYTVRPWNLV